MRLAKMSFDLWGALSPTSKREPPLATNGSNANGDEEEDGLDQSTAKLSEEAANKRTMSQAEVESSLYKYDGTFADHLEMTIQLGYVILFSSAFPLAALCAILNNLIEIRSDAFKLAYICQRPFGQRVPNIGTWQHCMEYMSIMAVLVNCALIGLSGQVHRMFPDMTATQTILLIVALEHIMLIIRFIITCAIPDIPSWLATEMAKIEWARREASRLNATPTATGPPSSSPSATPASSVLDAKSSKLIGRFSVSPSHSLASAGRSTISRSEEKLIREGAAASAIKDKDKDAGKEEKKATTTTTSSTNSSASNTISSIRALGITPESIQQIPPFKPRKSKEWTPAEGDSTHHLTIGPSGGAEWMRRLKVADTDIHKSSDCISATSTPKDASSSDSDLLKNQSSPLWPPRPRSPTQHSKTGPRIVAAIQQQTPSLTSVANVQPFENSSPTAAAAENADVEDAAAKAAAELAAKKTRVKQSLIKRARSVAIFSLKLKERRAREAQEKPAQAVTPTQQEKTPPQPLPPPQCGGGELSCIPIEKLIQLEDLRQQQRPGSTNLGNS